jgi:RHS repeat-associated protein
LNITVGSMTYGVGNVKNDGAGHSFQYDAEGRLYSVNGTNGTTCFTYDGDGDRVAKTNCNVVNSGNGHTTGILSEYLYDINHRLMTEVNAATQLMNRANIYAGSLYLAEDAPDAYLTNTPTASLLRVTDAVGTLRGRWDLGSNWDGACTSFPYGDGTVCTVAPLSTALFTGKDRDTESSLDYFGARYYSSTMGRFMSPDWSESAVPVPYANLSDPQTLNLYAYVRNNPVGGVDPNGHNWFTDVLKGLADSTYRPLVTAIEHPVITGKAVGNAVTHPISTVRAIRTGVVTTSQQVMTGNGTAIGTALGTAGMLFVPGGELGDVVEGAEDLAKVSEAVQTAADATKALKSDLQVQELMSGSGVPIAGAGTGTPLRDAARLAETYGGEQGDWVKITSSHAGGVGGSGSFGEMGYSGSGFEAHAYQNVKTGQVVEPKTKFQ